MDRLIIIIAVIMIISLIILFFSIMKRNKLNKNNSENWTVLWEKISIYISKHFSWVNICIVATTYLMDQHFKRSFYLLTGIIVIILLEIEFQIISAKLGKKGIELK